MSETTCAHVWVGGPVLLNHPPQQDFICQFCLAEKRVQIKPTQAESSEYDKLRRRKAEGSGPEHAAEPRCGTCIEPIVQGLNGKWYHQGSPAPWVPNPEADPPGQTGLCKRRKAEEADMTGREHMIREQERQEQAGGDAPPETGSASITAQSTGVPSGPSAERIWNLLAAIYQLPPGSIWPDRFMQQFALRPYAVLDSEEADEVRAALEAAERERDEFLRQWDETCRLVDELVQPPPAEGQLYAERVREALTILHRERAICRGEVKEELGSKPLPGNFNDGTDAACPGWWRAHDYTTETVANKLRAVADTGEHHGVSGSAVLEAAAQRILALRRERDFYKEVVEDKCRFAREIDVVLFGEEGAAKQPAMIDVLASVRTLVSERDVAQAEAARLREALKDIASVTGAEPQGREYWAGRMQERAAAALPPAKEGE